MAEDAPSRSQPVPAIIRSDADYKRVMERLAEIAEGKGERADPGEFSHLMATAESWEERSKR